MWLILSLISELHYLETHSIWNPPKKFASYTHYHRCDSSGVIQSDFGSSNRFSIWGLFPIQRFSFGELIAIFSGFKRSLFLARSTQNHRRILARPVTRKYVWLSWLFTKSTSAIKVVRSQKRQWNVGQWPCDGGIVPLNAVRVLVYCVFG